ncbi:pre-mRNA-splicing factor 38B isoform X1 [Chlorella sorokiniana]|uniref:Pre-mRNA-splicing factor 38 n=1 Tax=Chlorella sorokiniana TaxID=3076 RepID=A0A2P6U512_CHLSO|nr:pre-mRNA-splicing factor 38B isoform X1 [Chlorella sorokiniana]|eukprot:PRW61404.1 pre-mRNA-splicing factor 38B isoform X1 [Chlorella sorokiniana]
MSRSAIMRSIRLGGAAAAVPAAGEAPPPILPREGALEQYGNTTTYNLEPVLVQNIKRSMFWERRAQYVVDVNELIDVIYDEVSDVEPWMSGNARGPSTAFNLLYRLGQLQPDPREVRQMLDHKDSPYIRAVGFLYLRYACDPRKLWNWFHKYLRDTEEFDPSPQGQGCTVTMGDFVRDIMLDQFYFETIFPRVPKPVHDEIVEKLKEMDLPTAPKGNAGQGGPDRRGVGEGGGRPASVKASLSVAFGQRAPNRAGAREQGRGMGAELQVGKSCGREDRPRDRSKDERREERRDDYKRRSRSRSRERYDRDRRRDDRDDRRRDDRDRRRSRSRSRDRYERRRDDRGYDDRRGRDDRDYDRRREARDRDYRRRRCAR